MWQVVLTDAVFVAPASVLSSTLPTAVLLSRWFVRKRGFAMGIAAIGFSLGGFIFPPLVQYLISRFEWREGLRILSAIICLLSLPPIFFLAVDWPKDRNLYPDGDAQPPVVTPSAGVTSSAETAVLRGVNFWVSALAVGIVMAAGAAVMGNFAPFALDIGAGPEQAAFVISIYAIANLIGMLLFTSVADRIDLRYALVAAEIILLLSTLCFSSARTLLSLACGSALIGLSVGMTTPLFGFLVARLYGAAMMGRVMGRMNTVIMLLLVLAPPLFGWVRDVTGSYRYVFLFYTGLAGLAGILAPRIRLRPRVAVAPLTLPDHS
jgi:MFS family permease